MELMVVMVLMATMTGLVVPNIRNFLFDDPLKSSARNLTGIIHKTALMARAGQRPLLLSFDSDSKIVAVKRADNLLLDEKLDDKVRRPSLKIKLADSVEVVDIDAVHGRNIDEGKRVILFSSHGFVDKTIINLRDKDGESLTLVLSPFLTVVRIFEGTLTLDDERLTW